MLSSPSSPLILPEIVPLILALSELLIFLSFKLPFAWFWVRSCHRYLSYYNVLLISLPSSVLYITAWLILKHHFLQITPLIKTHHYFPIGWFWHIRPSQIWPRSTVPRAHPLFLSANWSLQYLWNRNCFCSVLFPLLLSFWNTVCLLCLM